VPTITVSKGDQINLAVSPFGGSDGAAATKIVQNDLVLAGYFTVARLVENLYPFSTFPMYAGDHTDSASRILAREADGSVHEALAYAAWSCEEPPDLDREPERCAALPRYFTIPYVDREIEAHIREHTRPEEGGTPVTIVRRVFRFPSGPGPARVEDCEIGRCRAVRR